jgi:hypothetical protein
MWEERQTDVAVAITILSDCYELGLERVIMMTADSDQVPAVQAIKQRFPATAFSWWHHPGG